MLQLIIRLGLVLLVLNLLTTQCSAYRNFDSGRGSKQSGGSKEPAQVNTLTGSSQESPSQPKARRGLGISAWGIIILIVAMILAGMGLYYFSICYPAVCRKNTKYDLMSVPTIA